jgi:hypothetical protein
MTQGFSGVGLITSHKRTTAGAKGIGTFWGNCPRYEIQMTPQAVERNSSMDVARSPLRRMTQATQAAVTIVTDEFNKKNVARATQGRIDEVADDPVTTVNKTHPTGAVVGDVLATDDLNINSLVVTDSSGSPKTLTLGVNYTADLFSGHVTLLDLTTGGPYVQPFKTANKKGAVSVISGLAVAAEELWIAFSGTNADNGLRCHQDTYRVRLDPASVLQFINSEYQDFELKGTALLDSTKLANSVGGQIFRIGLPSTHE